MNKKVARAEWCVISSLGYTIFLAVDSFLGLDYLFFSKSQAFNGFKGVFEKKINKVTLN